MKEIPNAASANTKTEVLNGFSAMILNNELPELSNLRSFKCTFGPFFLFSISLFN